jgi:regulator of protease activity HflC (stomatin/prohibitin superfamily)
VTQLAQTTMRSEIGKLTLDKTFAERASLNEQIVEAINHAAAAWGKPLVALFWPSYMYIRLSCTNGFSCLYVSDFNFLPSPPILAHTCTGLECLRYEIRDIAPPPGVRAAMELQAEAERRKRAQVLESEGEKESKINRAEGEKQNIILASEAARQDQINRVCPWFILAFCSVRSI